jgi:aminomuconate-semialdehyde/2-hydroxymuconate-6-semialdehyde dehydrogenase
MNSFLNFIDGEHRAGSTGEFLDVFMPSTGSAYARVALSTPADVDSAVRAAESAFPIWSGLSARSRGEWLRKLAAAIAAKQGALADAETRNTGKPIRLSATVDIPRSIHNFEFFADAATQFASESHLEPGVAIHFTLRQPLGVVGCISPWNLPLYLFTWKVAPALAAGNTVVAKPSEVTPHTAWLLSEILREIDFPKGVLNIVHGTGSVCGNAIVEHPRITAVSFTGSTVVGRTIAEKAGRDLKKVSLELGGKNALLVFEDCDWERMLDTVVRAAFSNQGQICLSASRILIQDSVYSRFKTDFLARVAQLKQGDPLDPQTDQGALVSKVHYEKVLQGIRRALEEKGELLCGGGAPALLPAYAHGWFVSPTVIEGLPMLSRTCQEEIFGPVATLHSFKSEAEALEMANQSAYGLAASIWTLDSTRIVRLSQQLKTGIVWANAWMQRDLRTPFGGMKQSGLGREGGWESMRFFTEPKNVCIAQ